jgi:hypothetical protein
MKITQFHQLPAIFSRRDFLRNASRAALGEQRAGDGGPGRFSLEWFPPYRSMFQWETVAKKCLNMFHINKITNRYRPQVSIAWKIPGV